jgi:hypothetical protein
MLSFIAGTIVGSGLTVAVVFWPTTLGVAIVVKDTVSGWFNRK